MNLAVDAREFLPEGNTGIGRYLANLLGPLSTHPELRLTLMMNPEAAVPAALTGASVTVMRLPAGPTQWVDQVVLPRLARQAGADVFFSPYYKVPWWGAFRRIQTVHDVMFLTRGELPPWKHALVAAQLRLAMRRANVVLVDSDYSGRDLAARVPSAQPKIVRLYPDLGGDWGIPPAVDQVTAVHREYADERPFFLYAGNFKPHKNVDLLVRAFAEASAGPVLREWRLILAGGDPSNRPRVSHLMAGLGLESRVRIHASIDDVTLRALYTAAQWFVTASEHEGFGYPPLEAMASGCPVICHPCTSLPEVVGDAALAISRLTVEGVCDALKTAAQMGPAQRQLFADKGRQRARVFCPGSAAGQFLTVLKRLL